MNLQKRCFGSDSTLYSQYHDDEWGIPVHDDQHLFEMLILEGAQAGLSWETILKRRTGYRDAFYNFDPERVAGMTDHELDQLRNNAAIIRNRLKIYAARTNARVFVAIQKEFGSFDAYVWRFAPRVGEGERKEVLQELPVTTAESDALARDLRKRGMSFVGSTILYAFMQAVGMVDDHLKGCWKARLF